MKNQVYHLGLKSALVLTFLFSSMQGCAGDASNNAKAVPNVEAANQAEAAKNVFKVVTKAEPTYFIDDKQNPELTLKRGVTYSTRRADERSVICPTKPLIKELS